MEVIRAECRSAVARSRLPGLDWAINPYRGCAHGCRYCYAQDVTRFRMDVPWGDIVEVKINLVDRLRKQLSTSPKGVYGLGTVTDPYQPLEKEYELSRGCLSLLKRSGADLSVLTKSDLVCRDLDLLRQWKGAEVGVSVCTADEETARVLEPRAPSPNRRLRALSELSKADINTYVMLAPVVPGMCDSFEDLSRLLDRIEKARVRRVIWDVFNPKPLASSRLRKAIEASGRSMRNIRSDESRSALRQFLRRECADRAILLEDAF